MAENENSLQSAWRALNAEGQVVPGAIQTSVRRHVWGRRLKRATKLLLILIILALIGWATLRL